MNATLTDPQPYQVNVFAGQTTNLTFHFSLAAGGTKAAKSPYGDVQYADPGYQPDGKKRYPLDPPEHARVGWSYIHQGKDADKYTPEQLAALDESSMPSLDFPAPNNAWLGPMLGFGGATVDGVEWPVWPMLEASPARY